MSMQIDKSAIERIKELSLDSEDNKILLVNLVVSGCSGYAYHYSWLDKNKVDEKKYKFIDITEDLKVAYPLQYEDELDGSILKFVTEGLNTRLLVENPNVVNECGCGESINFK